MMVAEMKAEFAASRSSGGCSLFGNAKLLQPIRFSGDQRQTRETLHTWLFTFEDFMNLQNLPKELWSRMAGQHLEGAAPLWYETRSKELPVADLLNWDRSVSDINVPVNQDMQARPPPQMQSPRVMPALRQTAVQARADQPERKGLCLTPAAREGNLLPPPAAPIQLSRRTREENLEQGLHALVSGAHQGTRSLSQNMTDGGQASR